MYLYRLNVYTSNSSDSVNHSINAFQALVGKHLFFPIGHNSIYPDSVDSHSHVSGKFFRTLMLEDVSETVDDIGIISWSSITFDL